MSRLNKLSFTLVATLLVLCPANGQDAHKILDQYVKAVGGSKMVSKLQSVSMDGTFAGSSATGMGDKPGTYTFILKQPNRYYSEIRADGKTLIDAYNGKSAWHQSESGEISTLLGEQAVQVEAAARYYNARMQSLAKLKIGAAYKGEAQVRGRNAQQVELTYPTGVRWEVFFDPQTHLIVEEKAVIGGVPRDIYYDDYRAVSGLKVPYKIEMHRGDQQYTMILTRVSVNETVGERVFDFPKKSQVQLPDLKKLFEQIDANQKEIDKVKENYAGTRVEEETEYDKSGKITKKEENEYTFFYLKGEEISTLVKKEGKPLSEEEQKKENEKTQKQHRGDSEERTRRRKPRKRKPRNRVKKQRIRTTSRESRFSCALASSSIRGVNGSAARTCWSSISSPTRSTNQRIWWKKWSRNLPGSSGSTKKRMMWRVWKRIF